MANKRVVVTAKITPGSAKGWRHFCDENGISMSAMLEVAGLELATETLPPSNEARRRMAVNARKIDRQRRVRRKS